VTSCLTVLQREGWARRIAPTERPGFVTFTGQAGETHGLRGQVYGRLREIAESGGGGAVAGAVVGVWPDRLAEELDLSREQVTAAIRGLSERGVLTWAAPERVGGVELLRVGEPLRLDEARMRERRARELQKLQRMVDYGTAACRRRAILQYFGDALPWTRCGECDGCRANRPLEEGPRPLVPDENLVARKVLACVARMDRPFSPAMVARVLTGSREESVTTWGFERLSTFGILRQLTQREVEQVVAELVRAGALLRDSVTREVGGRERTFAVVSLTALGREVMLERADGFAMRWPLGAEAATVRPATLKRPAQGARPTAEAGDLTAHLSATRARLARAEDVPAYVVAPNRTLEDMAVQRPRTLQAMLRVHGMGPERARRFGQAFLEALVAWERGT
jgi:superfamily II DNA helicase RecQ